MKDLQKRLDKLEELTGAGGAVYPVTTPKSDYWYIGGTPYATLEEVKAAYPGRQVKPVTLNVSIDLATI